MSALVIQLAIIFLPGIIWASLDAKYASRKELNQFRLILNAFLFGLATYGVLFILYAFCGEPFDLGPGAFQGTDLTLKGISDEVGTGVALSVVLAIIWIYASTYKLMTRFLQGIGATKQYGDEDVWDYTLNSPVPNVEFVSFRDFDKEIIYSGYVSAFSDTEKLRELVLRDAAVYDFSGSLLYEMPMIYISRKPDDLHLEFPYQG